MTISFDLWMSKEAHDIFALIMNFSGSNSQPKQGTIGLFEATETTIKHRPTIAIQRCYPLLQ